MKTKKENIYFQNIDGIQKQIRVTVEEGKWHKARFYIVANERQKFVKYSSKKYKIGDEIDCEGFFDLTKKVYIAG